MRWTRSRVILAATAGAVAVALGVLVPSWFSAGPAADTKVFAGTYTSDTDVRVSNLTIEGGHVRVAYGFDVLFQPSGEAGVLRCGLVDTSGRLDFFAGSRTVAFSGGWTHLEFAADYDLPELTLGIRCSPSADGPASMAFRGIRLSAEAIS